MGVLARYTISLLTSAVQHAAELNSDIVNKIFAVLLESIIFQAQAAEVALWHLRHVISFSTARIDNPGNDEDEERLGRVSIADAI